MDKSAVDEMQEKIGSIIDDYIENTIVTYGEILGVLETLKLTMWEVMKEDGD